MIKFGAALGFGLLGLSMIGCSGADRDESTTAEALDEAPLSGSSANVIRSVPHSFISNGTLPAGAQLKSGSVTSIVIDPSLPTRDFIPVGVKVAGVALPRCPHEWAESNCFLPPVVGARQFAVGVGAALASFATKPGKFEIVVKFNTGAEATTVVNVVAAPKVTIAFQGSKIVIAGEVGELVGSVSPYNRTWKPMFWPAPVVSRSATRVEFDASKCSYPLSTAEGVQVPFSFGATFNGAPTGSVAIWYPAPK